MAHDEADDGREQGVELGDLAEDLESLSYPVEKETLLSEYGDRELELPDGSETLAEVLEPLQMDEFESVEDVRQSIFNMVGSEAVGRQGYTDRGTGEADEQNESF